MKRLILLLILVLLPVGAWGADVYINPLWGDDSIGDGSTSRPYKTYSGLTIANSDTVYIAKGGVLREAIDVANSSITLKGYNPTNYTPFELVEYSQNPIQDMTFRWIEEAGGTYYFFSEGYCADPYYWTLNYRTSSDGFTLGSESASLLSLGEDGDFDEDGQADPCGVYYNSQWYMYYEGCNDGFSDTAIGLATGADLDNLTKQGSVLPCGSAGEWDDDFVHQPIVLTPNETGSDWIMIYMGSQTGYSYAALGVATSSDGITWMKYGSNPVISPSGAGDEAGYLRPSKPIQINNKWYMFYCACDANPPASGHKRSLLAVSDDLYTWTKLGRVLNYNTSPYNWEDYSIHGVLPYEFNDGIRLYCVSYNNPGYYVGAFFIRNTYDFPTISGGSYILDWTEYIGEHHLDYSYGDCHAHMWETQGTTTMAHSFRADTTLSDASLTLSVWLSKAGTGGSGSLTAYICSDNGGGEPNNEPDTELFTSTNSIDASDVAAWVWGAGETSNIYTFNFTGVNLTAGTIYWVKLGGSYTSSDSSNDLNIWKDIDESDTGGHTEISNGAESSWFKPFFHICYELDYVDNVYYKSGLTEPKTVRIAGTISQTEQSDQYSLTQNGHWYFDSGAMYTYGTSTGDIEARGVEIPNRDYCIDSNSQTGMKVQGLTLEMTKTQMVNIDANDAVIWANIFRYGNADGTTINGNAEVYNNVFYYMSDDGVDVSAGRVLIKNNIFIEISDADTAGGTTSNNNADTTDPKFTDAANADFTLQPSSPCINTGIDPFGDGDGDHYDMNGMKVWSDDVDAPVGPWGDGVEIGAYGYIGTPTPDIKANGRDGPLIVTSNESVSVTVTLDAGDKAGINADLWVAASTPFGWFSYVYPSSWQAGIHPCMQTPLFNLPQAVEVLNMTLPYAGGYNFYFAIDNNADGVPDATWFDLVTVTVQ